jgi:hypothetical protein
MTKLAQLEEPDFFKFSEHRALNNEEKNFNKYSYLEK